MLDLSCSAMCPTSRINRVCVWFNEIVSMKRLPFWRALLVWRIFRVHLRFILGESSIDILGLVFFSESDNNKKNSLAPAVRFSISNYWFLFVQNARDNPACRILYRQCKFVYSGRVTRLCVIRTSVVRISFILAVG